MYRYSDFLSQNESLLADQIGLKSDELKGSKLDLNDIT